MLHQGLDPNHPPLMEKIKMKNDLHALKQILYDMDPLTVAFPEDLEVQASYMTTILAEKFVKNHGPKN